MPTIVTFCVLAVAGVVLWWLLRDAFGSADASRGPKCPVCGGRRARPLGDLRRCAACGAEFKAHEGRHLHEPTLPAVSVILLAFVGLLLFALFDMVLRWQIMGTARSALLAAAAAGGIAASVCSFIKHRKETGRN